MKNAPRKNPGAQVHMLLDISVGFPKAVRRRPQVNATAQVPPGMEVDFPNAIRHRPGQRHCPGSALTIDNEKG